MRLLSIKNKISEGTHVILIKVIRSKGQKVKRHYGLHVYKYIGNHRACEEQCTKEQCTKEQYTKEQYTKEQHTKEQHTKEQYTKGR